MQIFTRKTIRTLLLILTWYVLSTGLSLYNKKTVGDGLFGDKGFPAPLLMSSIQFACQTLLAKLVFALGIAQRTNSRCMAWSDYLRLVVPNGIITGLDIGFSNKSMAYINVSFYTMCKSTVPIFLLFFAFIWGLERPNLELMGVVVVITAGLLLLVQGETEFNLLGFGLVMTASCLSGLRFTLMQVLLHGHHSSAALGGPLEVLEMLTPIMSATTLLFSLAWEEPWAVLPASEYFNSGSHSAITVLAIAWGAIFAFLMVWTEYQVIKETSALTFMVAGTVKEVVTVLTAVVVRGEKITLINGLGLVVVIIGVLLFNYHKYRKIKETEVGQYAAVDSSEEGHMSDGDGKPLRRQYGGSSGGGGGATSVANGSAPPPVSAAAVAAGTSLSVAAASQHASGAQSSHHAASGLLGRAIAGILNRNQGNSAAAGSELSPLLSTSGGGGGEVPSGHRAGMLSPTSARDWDRENDVEGRVVGVGNSGDDPAAAMSLSGAGISGPPRAGRAGTRGLVEEQAGRHGSSGGGSNSLGVPLHPLLSPPASGPQLR